MTDLATPVAAHAATLFDVLRDNASRDPDSVAFTELTFPTGTSDADQREGRGIGVALTRGAYDRRASAVAATLVSQVGPGCRVLVLLAPGLDLVVGLTGVLYAGAVAVTCPPPTGGPGDPRTQRAALIAGHAQVSAVITTADLHERLADLRTRLGGVPWLAVDTVDESAADAFVPPARETTDLALLQYAPGPTGARRGVMVNHANLLAQLRQTVALAGLPAATNVVSWISPYHALGIGGHLLLSQFVGGHAVLLTPEDFVADPLRWLRAISDLPGPVFACAPNFAFDRCVEHISPERRNGLDLSGWHTTFNAAERVRPHTIARFSREFAPYGFRPRTMAPGFGMTEAMLFLTGRHADPAPSTFVVDPGELEHGRVVPATTDEHGVSLVGLGSAGPHCEVFVVDPDERTVLPDDRVGEVWARGPVVCQGYWRRPELSAETFGATLRDGTGPFLRTGDLGFCHDGELVLCGRRKELIIIRGRNLFPQDVEATCERLHPALSGMPAAAFSVDRDDGEHLIVVQAVRHTDDIDPDDLAARLRAAVTGEHEVEVHEVLLVEPGQVPCDSDGTVRRRACRDRYLAGDLIPLGAYRRRVNPPPAGVAPPMREVLLALEETLRGPVLLAELRRRLGELLAVAPENICADTPLAGLGLESVRAIELRRDLERDLGVAVPVAQFVRYSVTDLAALIGDRLPAAPDDRDIAWRPVTPDPAHRYEPFPLTEQQHAYFVGRSTGYDLGEVSVHIYLEIDADDLDLDRLADALNRLVAHQEMLRAVVRSDGTQQILPADTVPSLQIALTDLTDASEQEQTAHLAGIRDELSHQVLALDTWPMFEVRATRLSEATTRVHISVDLLVADVASVRLFFLEWGDLYRDPGAHPRPPAVSFRDYVLALEQVQASPAYRRSREYWLSRVPDLPPGPDLPVVGGADRHGRTRRTHVLDATRWSRLRERAAAHGLTPSVVQLAAFCEVLGRWSRSSRFTINVPLFNRMPLHPDIDTVIGDFTAVTLLEVDVGPNDGLGRLAERIQRQLWQDLEHRYFSGVQVIREVSRHTGAAPGLFTSVVFASAREQGRDRQGAEGALGSAWLGETGYVVSQTPQVSFDHQVYEDRGTLSFNWDVVEGMFPGQVLDDMFTTYCRLLERLAEDEEIWEPGALDTLPAVQRELVRAANDTTGPTVGGLLHEPLVEWACREPDRPAVVAQDTTLSFGELYRRACVLARELVALGVGRHELVAVAADKSAAQVVAVLGVLLAGAAYLPVDPDLPDQRQEHLVSVGRCRAVVSRAGGPRRDWAGPVSELAVDLDKECPPDVEAPMVSASPEDLAYVIFTSGSTGIPKGVMIRHSAVRNTMADINERYEVGPGDAVLGLSSLSFDLSVYDMFGVLGAGGRLVLPRHAGNRDPGHWVDLVVEHGVTLWNSVPALAQMLVEQVECAGPAGGLDSLRLALMSGDWLPVDLPDRLRAQAPSCRPVSLGGATEASVWSIAHDIGEVDATWDSVPYGRALRNQSVHVFNDRWNECPVWVTGELFIGGVGLADGYWANKEETAARFVTHPVTGERLYRTGDLGRWRPDGLIEFLGRQDGQVKIGGYRIELGEIEAALARHHQVRDAVVVSAGADRHRRRLVAFVVPAAPTAGTDLDPSVADKALLGDVVTDPARRAEFTMARHARRRDLTGQPVRLPAGLDEDEAARLWQRRASRRVFADDPVQLDDLGRLLECLRSREGVVLPKYRYASAGALYPVQTYIYVKPGRLEGLAGGSYYHDPQTHRLLPVRPGADLDRAVHVGTNLDAFDSSAFEIFLVARMSAITPLYGSRATHFCLLEAGQMAQLLDEAAPGLALGLCQIGLLRDEEAVRDLLALAPEDLVLHSLLGGGYRPTTRPDRPAATTLPDRLRTHAAANLPHYMVPASIVVLDRLPLSQRGKVDRTALEHLADTPGTTGRHSGTAPYAAPDSATEQTIAEVIRRVLGIDRIGVDDRFFDLGADSVALVRVYRELSNVLEVDFPLIHMFEHPTIRRLAAGLDGGERTGAVDAAFASGSRRRARRRGVARGEERS